MAVTVTSDLLMTSVCSDLTHNEITAIKQETFRGLESLQYLFVDHNRVSNIEDGALRELPALQVL